MWRFNHWNVQMQIAMVHACCLNEKKLQTRLSLKFTMLRIKCFAICKKQQQKQTTKTICDTIKLIRSMHAQITLFSRLRLHFWLTIVCHAIHFKLNWIGLVSRFHLFLFPFNSIWLTKLLIIIYKEMKQTKTLLSHTNTQWKKKRIRFH